MAVVVFILSVAPALHAHALVGFNALLETQWHVPGAVVVALRRTKVALVEAAVIDHRRGLQFANHGVDRRVLHSGHVHVPPESADLSIVRA